MQSESGQVGRKLSKNSLHSASDNLGFYYHGGEKSLGAG